MPLPLPNLDDRRWQDLTDEAIPLLPRYAPQLTDFNAHDPGITMLEMLAWLTESMTYQLNQVPDRFKWKFLSFIGYPKRGPAPSHTVIAFDGVPAGPPISLPQGVQFTAAGTESVELLFATAHPIDISRVTLSAMQVDTGNGVLRDYSRDMFDGLPVHAMGVNPAPGAALYFGFDEIPAGSPVAFWLWFAGPGNTAAERARIVAEAARRKRACKPPAPGWDCGESAPSHDCECDFTPRQVPPHHSAQVVWEVFSAGTWTPLTHVDLPARPAAGQIVDDTRSLTLDGLVEVNLPPGISKTALGASATPYFYLRVRLARGAYDAPVVLRSIRPNAVSVVQRIPLWQQLAIAGSVPALAMPPSPGDPFTLQFTLSPDLKIQTLAAQAPPAAGAPSFRLLNYAAPAGGNAGSITSEFTVAGIGTAVPFQQVHVPLAPLDNRCIHVYTHDGASWLRWIQVADFEASRRSDLAYTLDPVSGLITCGDGEHGQVFPQGRAIVVTGFATHGDGGNLVSHRIKGLAKTPANDVLLSAVPLGSRALISSLAANPVPAEGGRAVAPLTELEGEAAELVHAHGRILDLAERARQTTLDQIPKAQVLALPAPSQAVNLLDTERNALEVAGTRVARARAWPDTDPHLKGIHAAGVVTVVILPDMPVAMPMPSAGLLAAVRAWLDRRRILCTRIEVTPATYVVIAVTAAVKAQTGASIAAVRQGILDALASFLSPLSGGPAGLGWPFGRDIYHSEILQLIAEVAGVDHVDSMTMTADSGKPLCGDITLCPTFLPASGEHQIQVTAS
jgi:hypothetical protein